MRVPSLGVLAQSVLYIASGINHFWHQDTYVGIMPDHYRHPRELVRLSGAAEILGGTGLLVPMTQQFSAVGIVAMLLVFLDVHQSMLRHSERFPNIPKWMLWGRIPLQFVLIGWAWRYARTRARS